MGHVRMMAAVQPFLSGAISKTVNLPESATVEEIEDVYVQGWKMGLKALAVYRDNCKVGQRCPTVADAKDAARRQGLGCGVGCSKEIVEKVVYRPTRERLPKRCHSQTTSFTVGGAEGYLTAGTTTTAASARCPQVRQAGLHARRCHGRLLDRHLGRAAVRRAAGDVRRGSRTCASSRPA